MTQPANIIPEAPAVPAEAAPEAPADAPRVLYQRSGQALMADQEGEVYSIDPDKVEEATSSGWRPATEGEFYAAREGLSGDLAAAAYGAARTVSFGLSDPLYVEAMRGVYGDDGADIARKVLREGQEYHRGADLAGQVVGSIPLMMMGGGGAGAEVAGETMLARAGSRFLQAAPRAFAEGAAIGAGQQLTEDTLGNHDLAAQKYLASALKGGALGVLLAGGLSAGGGLIADKLGGVMSRGGVAAEGKALTALEGAAEREGNVLARVADEQAFKGIGAKIKDIQKLGRTAEQAEERMQRIGRTLMDEGISTPGASKAVQAQRLTKRVGEVGEELSTLRKGLEKAAARPSAEAVLQRIESEVLQPLRNTPFAGAELATAEKYAEEIATRAGGKANFGSFDELFRLRRALDEKLDPKLWAKVPGSAPQGAVELGKIRGILEDEFEKGAVRATEELGGDMATKYQTTKALFSDLKTAEKIATKEAARSAANRAVSLTDTIAGAGGFVALGPQGIALAVANKAMREYGNQAAAGILSRASKIEAIANAANAFNRKLDTSVLAFFGKAKPSTAARTAENVSPQATRALRDAAQNPSAMAERVSDALVSTELRSSAPKVTQAMASTMMRAGAWLQQKLPPEPPPRSMKFGDSKPRPLGPKAQKEVNNAFRALDPDAFLDDLSHGRVDRQALDAMKFINPELYTDVVGRLRQYGIDNQPDLSRQQAVALSIITGTPLTPLMKPETIRGFQESYAQDGQAFDPEAPGLIEKKEVGSGPPPVSNRARTARAFMSGTDRMEATDDL